MSVAGTQNDDNRQPPTCSSGVSLAAKAQLSETILRLPNTAVAALCVRSALRALTEARMETVSPSYGLTPDLTLVPILRAILVAKTILLTPAPAPTLKAAAIDAEGAVSDLLERVEKYFHFAHHTDQLHLAISLNCLTVASWWATQAIRWTICSAWHFKIKDDPSRYYEQSTRNDFVDAARFDATRLAGRPKAVERLLAEPVWPAGPPERFMKEWTLLENHNYLPREGWQTWFSWCEFNFYGRAVPKELELSVACIGDRMWRGNPNVLNVMVRRIFGSSLDQSHGSAAKPSCWMERITDWASKFSERISDYSRAAFFIVLSNLKSLGSGNAIAGLGVVIGIITGVIALYQFLN